MVLDNDMIATVVSAVAVIGYVRLVAKRVFAKLHDMSKGIGAGILQTDALHRTLQSEPGVTEYDIVSTEPDGSINHRHSSRDTEYPFRLWKDLETGVPGQHRFLQNGSVIGYLDNA